MSDNNEITKSLSEDDIFFTVFEPKVVSRFICYIKDKDDENIIPSFLIKEITRPSVTRKDGKWIWNPIQIRTYDPIVPSATQLFYDYILQEPPPKFNMLINVLGPVGDVVEKWEITNAEISEVNFGTLDWCKSSDQKSPIHTHNLVRYHRGSEAVEITATIVYDFASLRF